jgi:hypothetical protein
VDHSALSPEPLAGLDVQNRGPKAAASTPGLRRVGSAGRRARRVDGRGGRLRGYREVWRSIRWFAGFRFRVHLRPWDRRQLGCAPRRVGIRTFSRETSHAPGQLQDRCPRSVAPLHALCRTRATVARAARHQWGIVPATGESGPRSCPRPAESSGQWAGARPPVWRHVGCSPLCPHELNRWAVPAVSATAEEGDK